MLHHHGLHPGARRYTALSLLSLLLLLLQAQAPKHPVPGEEAAKEDREEESN
jgi:hypothetical protein